MMTKVLFVCTGNICRSPSAEGVFRHMITEAGRASIVGVDSAATHGFHVGESPDARAQAAARKRGYDISQCVARQITADDYREFDLILVMDWENLSALQQQCPRFTSTNSCCSCALPTSLKTRRSPTLIMVVQRASTRFSTVLKTPARVFSRSSVNAPRNIRLPEL